MNLRDQLQESLGASYVLERELGGGGMSRVFLAAQPALERNVVVKVLPPELAAAVSMDRFRREIRLAANLQHPNIVPVLTAGDADGLPYYIMPFVSGDTLRNRLTQSGELPIRDVVGIFRDVLDALAYAHQQGVIHRDIKPENVLLAGHHALVTDFGVAKAIAEARDEARSSPGVAIGTPAYMAPEQSVGDPNVDHRADLYAVAALAYEMLTGHQLFPGLSPRATISAQISDEVPDVRKERPATPDALALLIKQALEKRPADRPQSAQEMLAALNAVQVTNVVTPVPTLAAPRKRATLPAIAAVSAALIVFLSAIVWQRETLAPARSGPPRLAVLPFENDGRAEDAYFVDGMTEAITSRLASVSGLRVIGRQSARRYAHSDKSLRQIGSELQVDYLLTGSVRWDKSRPGSDHISIRPALVRVSDETQLWGVPYDVVLSDIFQLQGMVAERVAASLAVALAQREREMLAAIPTTSLAAYDDYLRGRFFLNQRTAKSISSAIESFESAIHSDSTFARAYGGVAEAYWVMPSYSSASVSATHERAGAAADKALEIDPSLAAAHATRAYLYADAGRWKDAESEFRRAIALEPDYATPHQWFSRFLIAFGRADEAVREAVTARALEPRSPVVVANYSMVLRLARRFPQAETVIREAIATDPSAPIHRRQYINLLLVSGRYRDALPEIDTALALSDSDVVPNLLAYRAHALAHLGDTSAARGQLGQATKLAAGQRWYAEATSAAHLALGDTAIGLSLLEDLLTNRPEWWLLAVDPLYDPVRGDARFVALLRRKHVDCTRPTGLPATVPPCVYLTSPDARVARSASS